jgi:hypothetical protein
VLVKKIMRVDVTMGNRVGHDDAVLVDQVYSKKKFLILEDLFRSADFLDPVLF